MTAFSLRPCTADDLDLAFAISEDAMRGYVEQTWGRWDREQQVIKHRRDFDPATHRLLLVGDAVAGLVAVEDEPEYLWLVKLYLRSDFRRRGLGSAMLQRVRDEARAKSKRVRLRVLRVNTDAKRLYERHGFRVAQQTPERFFMESGA